MKLQLTFLKQIVTYLGGGIVSFARHTHTATHLGICKDVQYLSNAQMM